MATKRKRGPKHPGVVFLKPDPERRIGWRVRFVDPDSGKTVKESLDAALRTAELREEWAVRKSKALARRRLELDGGAARATGTGFDAAIEQYFTDHPQLRPGTLGIYRAAAGKLKAWAARTRVHSADDLTGARLVAFRAELVKEPLRASKAGGKRGARKETEERRSPHTINRELRSVRTILGYIRKRGLLPRLSSDELGDALERVAAGLERIVYLKPHELQKLLDAALRHDADTFAATREEHAGLRPVGSTARYQPIAPFVATVLITGLRFGTALALAWDEVDLDALDGDGGKVGEITPRGGSSTKRPGVIGLEISPALRKLLAAMQLKSGSKGSVFGLSRDTAKAATKRLLKEYGAPRAFTWQVLRSTCGCFLTNAPAIFGAASAYRSAKQLGHSVAVAEKHYIDVIRGISRDARTVEAAMQIEEQMQRVIASVGERPERARKTA